MQSRTLQNRYQVIRELGGGGMGTVYLAEDTRLPGRQCAIKQLSPADLAASERNWAIQAFRQEAGMLANLRHPGLTAVTDFFPEGGNWYLVMEFVEGETLEDRLKRAPGGRLPLSEALEITRQLCAVLEYLHALNPPLVFRDLKPGNIMLNAQGQVKLIDFGIARLFKPGQTRDTMNLGTPGYAAPEQYGGMGQSDPRTDVYSLGAVLLQMLTGYNPVMANTPFPLPPPGQFVRNLPPHIEQAITCATQLHPHMRFANIRDFQQALQGNGAVGGAMKSATVAIPQQHGYQPTITPVSGGGAPAKQSNKGLIIGAIVVLIFLCVAGGIGGTVFWEQLFPAPTSIVSSPTPPNTVVVTQESTPVVNNPPIATPTQEPTPEIFTLTPTSQATPEIFTLTPTSQATPVPTLQWSDIGYSVQRRELSLATIGYSGRTAVVIVGSIQGDQDSTRDLVNSLITQINNNKQSIPAGTMFYFIPSINPDGNTSGSRYNANGVDLNRNWDTRDWRPDPPVPGYPQGKAGAGGRTPFSEPETRALRDLLSQLQSQGVDLRVIEFHASVNSPNEVYAAGSRSGNVARIFADTANYSVEQSWSAYTPTGELLTWCEEQGIIAIDVVIPQRGVSSIERTFQALIAVAQYNQ